MCFLFFFRFAFVASLRKDLWPNMVNPRKQFPLMNCHSSIGLLGQEAWNWWSKIFESDDYMGLALNEMVNSDGIFNQQGSILHMAMGHQNSNSDGPIWPIIYVLLPYENVTLINWKFQLWKRVWMIACWRRMAIQMSKIYV